MKRTRAQAFRQVEPHLAPDAKVAILGPLSRTWYRDQGALFEVLELMDDRSIVPVIVGATPFRLCATEAIRMGERAAVLLDHLDPEADLFIEQADLCIVLPCRKSQDVTSASPYVEVAMARGTPVLAIWADGNATYHATEVTQ